MNEDDRPSCDGPRGRRDDDLVNRGAATAAGADVMRGTITIRASRRDSRTDGRANKRMEVRIREGGEGGGKISPRRQGLSPFRFVCAPSSLFSSSARGEFCHWERTRKTKED